MNTSQRAIRVMELVDAIREREAATSDDQYRLFTSSIDALLASIEKPSVEMFIAIAERLKKPWVRIIGQLLEDIASGRFALPFRFDQVSGTDALLVRTGHIMDHLSATGWLALKGDDLHISTHHALTKQMNRAGVLLTRNDGSPQYFERVAVGHSRHSEKRVAHMVGIKIVALHGYGLDVLNARRAVRND